MNRNKAIDWIMSGDTGISSQTMWYALMSDKPDESKCKYIDKPYDAADFWRCLNFVRSCEVTRDDLAHVVDVFPFWKPYIDRWDNLVSLCDNRLYLTLYEVCQELERESDNIRKGGCV